MRSVAAVAFAAVLLFGLLAGCVSQSGEEPAAEATPVREPAWAVKAIFAGADPDETGRIADHDHSNKSLHMGLSTPNFQVLGHDPIYSDYYESSSGTTYCGDVADNGTRQLAVVHSFQSDVAIAVLDVTDRARPVTLGELVLPYAFTYDAAIFADGKYAVIAANPDLASDSAPVPPVGALMPFAVSFRDACSGLQVPVKSNVDYVPYGYAAILVDLSDPTSPVVADFYEYPAGRNVHSISTAIVDGTRYVLTSGLMALPCTVPSIPGNPVPNPVPCEPAVPRFGNALSHYDFLTVSEGPTGARLALDLVYTPIDQQHLNAASLYLSNGHTDGTIEKHPITEETLAYLADWDGGLHIIRLDGPGQATALASWGVQPGDDPTQMKGNIHSAWPVPGLRNGHHYLLVGQEVVGRPTGRPSGQVDLLDISVPNQPIQQAKWTLPVDVLWPPSEGEMFSTHYPILIGDTLFVSLYHGGVWAVDARQQSWPDLPSIGVFVPDMDPAGTPARGGPTPEVLEVLSLGDGNLLVFDGTSGAYTLRFTGIHPDVAPAAPWPNDPWIS